MKAGGGPRQTADRVHVSQESVMQSLLRLAARTPSIVDLAKIRMQTRCRVYADDREASLSM